MRIITFLVFLSISTCVYSAPSINTVSIDGSQIAITGAAFSTKTTAAPAYLNTFDDDTTGGSATGLTTPLSERGIISTDQARDGKSLKYTFETTGEQFKRDIFDFGSGQDYVYVTAWVRLHYEITGTVTNSFQWKGVYVASNADGYEPVNAIDNGVILNYWMRHETGAWFNVYGTMQNGAASGWANGDSLDSDAYIFDGWQRLEMCFRRSSGASVADAVFYVNRIGRSGGPFDYKTNAVSHDDAGDSKWRYVNIGQALASVGGGGTAKLEVWFDELYIDNSWARVEIGNDPVLENCTHREIQPATTWTSTDITTTLNQGSLPPGDYWVFVIDESGVPSAGEPITIGETSSANPIVEILTASGQTTTASVFEITGTATADTGLTIVGVTCPGQTVTADDGTWDELSESWTCQAALSVGVNNLVFTVTDSVANTGTDSITVTRTETPTSHSLGKGFYSNGINFK